MIDVGARKFSKQIHIVGVSFVGTYGSGCGNGSSRARDINNIGSIGHGGVGISSVGLREPRATLALWLGWTPRYHGT